MKYIILLLLLLLPNIGSSRTIEKKEYINAYGYRLVYTKDTYRLINRISSIGYGDNLAKYIVKKCKVAEASNWKIDALHCVALAVGVGAAESTHSINAYRNNVWGFRNKTFKTKEEAFDKWIKSYKKHWYNNKPADMYGYNGKPGKSRYCVDEYSSGTKGWCPNGLKHSKSWFEYIINKRYLN